MRLGELFRQLQGKQPEPSKLVGAFALLPDPSEQQKIQDYSGTELGKRLRDHPGIAAMTAYDSFFALEDGSKKTEDILSEMANKHGNSSVRVSLWTVNELRKKEKAPAGELLKFQQFCAQVGFNFTELSQTQVQEAITSDQIASAVELHVDKIS